MTVDQRMDALHRANEIRSRRAQLKRDVRAGMVQAVDIIAEPPEWADTMRVGALLDAISGVGDSRTRRWLDHAHVSVTATLAHLTVRQRRDLAASVGRREPKVFRAFPGVWQPQMRLANTVRRERAELRTEVAALSHEEGRERVAVLLENPPALLLSMRVVDVLAWADHVGPCHARRFMSAARVSLSRTVDFTTDRQRKALAACLRGNIALVREEAEVREWAARPAA